MKSRWLRLIRIHTASLTQGVVFIGLMLSPHWSWYHVGLFSIFGILFHAAGFVDNDIRDFPYDQEDKVKQHFPMVSGEITLKQAIIVYRALTLISLLFGVVLSNLRFWSLFFLFTAFVFGHIYNRRCKKDIFSPLYITASLISLPLFSYYALSDHLSLFAGLAVLYIAFLMLFQSSIEGYLKDIGSDKVSLVKTLGTNYTDSGSIDVSMKTRLLAWSLKIPTFVIFIVIAFSAETHKLLFILGFVVILGTIWAIIKLTESGRYENEKRVRFCAIIEVLTYTLLVFGLQGVLNWWALYFLILYPYVWYVVLNRLTWETLITPRV